MDEEKSGIEPMPTRIELMRPIVEKLISGDIKLSYTALSNFIDSPKDFAEYKLQRKEPTEAMIYGSMVHCLILEPSKFEERYFTFDDSDKCTEIGGAKPRATKAYKEWKAITCMAAGDRIIVSPKDHQHAKIVALNVIHNKASSKIMRLCPVHETPIAWQYLNFFFHGFMDGEGEEDVFDIKTMPDAHRDKVQREIWQRKLYLQAALYLTGIGKRKNYHIIGVDKTGGISVHTLKPSLIEQGMTEYEYYVKRFNHAVITEAWDQSQDFWSERWDGIFDCDKANWMYG